jgi:hypothetical protein
VGDPSAPEDSEPVSEPEVKNALKGFEAAAALCAGLR